VRGGGERGREFVYERERGGGGERDRERDRESERGREFVYERERESAKAKKRMNEKEFRIHIITHPLPRHSVSPHGFYLSFASRFQVPKRLKKLKKK
jgi:hypothetical protein